jgi:hypothetical protein
MDNTSLRARMPRSSVRRSFAATSVIAMLAIAGCGGGGGDPALVENGTTMQPDINDNTSPPPEEGASTPPVADSANRLTCGELAGMRLDAAAIGLPTSGADITSATLIAPTAETQREYCEITGAIRPVAQNAPDIQFQLNLPTSWNRKAVQFGGTGFGGSVVTGAGTIPYAPTDETPLSQGYVTFGSDTGHQGGSIDFALNDEALANFGGDQIKKTRDVAVSIVESFYASRPDRTYYAGGSTGGREALTAIQRWPADYDGVIASAPLLNFTGMRLNGIRIGQANYAPGGFLNQEKRNLVRQASLAACDRLDDLQDAIVGNVAACRAISDTTLASLRCQDGSDQGNTCLSDPQIATIQAVHTDLNLSYALADGVSRYEGYNVLEGGDTQLGSDPILRDPPTVAANGSLFGTGTAWARFFMSRDPGFDVMSFDPLNPGQFLPRVQALSSIVGATTPDLSSFQARGGKVILMHGLADSVASPNSTIDYYNKVAARLGQQQADAFVRLYAVPGFNHDYGVFRMSWDALGALDSWVETNNAPGTLIGTDINDASAGRTRPLCVYPAFPRYVGGERNLASSFNCVQS